MKYGQNFEELSVPQWAINNIDYNNLKNLIKANTTKGQSQAIAIPGQEDTALQRFEEFFFNELANEHDRVDLFVKTKADEINRRLQWHRKTVIQFLARCSKSAAAGKPISGKRVEKFAKLDMEVEGCGEDIRCLQRFTTAQRIAFHKILKKYKKWTGSRAVEDRFNHEVLASPKSFVRYDFEPLSSQYRDLITTLRASSPVSNGQKIPSSPSLSRDSRPPSTRSPIEQPSQQAYWNEYDDGSEAENESYTILVDPDAESFPGARSFAYIFASAKRPVDKVKTWLSRTPSEGERQPLLRRESYVSDQQNAMDTEVEDEAYASSSDFPSGYAAHYATFPSVNEQRFSRKREQLLFRSMLGCFGSSIVFLAIASILFATGKRKLRAEVDAGVLVGVIASLFFGVLGVGCVINRGERLSWIHRGCVTVIFSGICIISGVLLSVVAENGNW